MSKMTCKIIFRLNAISNAFHPSTIYSTTTKKNAASRLLFKTDFSACKFCCRPYSSAETVAAKKMPASAPKREQYNVGTIGHIDHGKTTLTAAVTKILAERGGAKFMSFEDIDRAPEEQRRGITMNIAHISYQTPTRHYAHTDCPGHKDFIKNMICGASQMDAAILVIAATDGVMPQTREHVMLAKRMGVENMIIFINKADKVDKDMLDLVELETRELLTEFGFEGSKVPVVCGSALCALEDVHPELGRNSILNLVAELDKLPAPERNFEGSFYMPVQSRLSVTGRGTVAIGTVERGTLKKGDSVEFLGFGRKNKVVASDIQVFNKPVNEVKAGDHCGILCRGTKKEDVKRGYWLVAAGSSEMHNAIRAECYFLTKEEGGRAADIPIRSGFSEQIRCTTWEQSMRMILPPHMDMLMPGDHATCYFALLKPMPLEKGLSFTVSQCGRNTIMSGIISDILPDIPNLEFDDLKFVALEKIDDQQKNDKGEGCSSGSNDDASNFRIILDKKGSKKKK